MNMGLGSLLAVSLADARKKAAEARTMVDAKIDPIAAKRQTAKVRIPTFGEAADLHIAAKESGWRHPKSEQQWTNTLKVDAKVLRSMQVDAIMTEDVLRVLRPIWLVKQQTAMRVRARIEAVLDSARAHGHIPLDRPNPARWAGHLAMLLSKPVKSADRHHPAMSYADVPAFMGRLRERAGLASLAMQFLVLTAARSGEVLGARWDEVDIKAKLWTVPGARMKGHREHRVPLADAALAVLEEAAKVRDPRSDFVFPGQRKRRPLGASTLGLVLRDMVIADATPHGFRSSFRSWCTDKTSTPREIAEAALAHAVGDETEQAYSRSDALERRRKLMAAWARFIDPKTPSNVVKLPRRAAS
ncbi:Integrase [Rhizobiales bacterium GAS188]|nr:Integrase [Rhizobiales bacterium GAS188]